MTVVDVKAASKLADPAVTDLFGWTGELAGWRGWGFEVWSGADRQLLDNVRFLAGYRRPTTIDRSLIPVVLNIVADQPSIAAIEHVLSGRHPPLLVRPVVLHLLWTGRLRADLTRPLSADTPLGRDEV